MALKFASDGLVFASAVDPAQDLQQPIRSKADLKKIVLHEVKLALGGYKQTGRRMYIDRDCPVFTHLNGGLAMIEDGEGAVDHTIFDELVQIVEKQNAKEYDSEDELQSIAQPA